MTENIFVLSGIIVGIGLISGLITNLRTASFATPEEIAAKGSRAIRRERISFYALFMPILTGVISFYVFRFMSARWPESAETSFLWLAIGFAVLFTVLAAVVFKWRGFIELTALHILYAAGFGWLMPRLMAL